MFGSSLQQPSTIVKAIYSVAMLIAKKIKPFSDGELVKDSLEAVIKDVLPDKSKLFSSIILSRQNICHRIEEDISAEIAVTLRDKINQLRVYSLAFDESTDISDTSQLMIFIRGLNDSFQVTEEMLNILNLKDTTRGEDVFQAIENCLAKNSLNFGTPSGLTTGGAPALVGKNKGAVKLLMDKLGCRGIKINDIFIIHC
ncbi:general transcription factor II-I repeat domain-containing protein 2-like [Lycorma delicatula]|uniref:general transcription factor II-I repeat domain-containing protein 2-like n=1 Tax=Lycorma delicatula TaxID=130591 RepID=UPI003F51322C